MGPLITLDGTTTHMNSSMRIVDTKKVFFFREVTVVEQALVQKIVATVKEAYLTDIRNRMTNSIKDTVSDIITHLQ